MLSRFLLIGVIIKLQFLGHSFFKLSFPKCNLLIDPFFGNPPDHAKIQRLIQCPIKQTEMKDIDAILVSHEHFDHFDKEAIEAICTREKSIVISTDDVLAQLKIPIGQKRAIVGNQMHTIKNVKITAVPVHHPNAFDPLGFKIVFGDTTVFHAGDTDLIPTFQGLKPTIALLPIGGTVTMDCVDAVRAVKTMKPEYAIPMHYNTFDIIKAQPNEFKEKLDKSIIKTEAQILKPGQTFTY
ncbi:MAG: metal-dependent hydrolase [Candidatus Diapherotrites archaeon]|nr:metal-dependent hydrolase [Candidatus Diapherotrites archaeon]